MSEAGLQECERDVEAARHKLESDLARFRSDETVSEFKATVKSEVLGTTDAMMAQAKSKVSASAQEMFDTVRAKAAANPGALLAIGAGLAWRMSQKPPIATALVGAGLFSLLRTTATERSGPDMFSQAADFADRAKEKAEQWSTEAVAFAKETSADVSRTARTAGDGASAVLSDTGEALSSFGREAATRASETTTAVRAVVADRESRDTILLGVAASAVAAALGIAFQRRASEPDQP